MNKPVKIAIYAVLIIASAWFARAFYAEYKSGGDIHTALEKELSEDLEDEEPQEITNTTPSQITNAPGATNLPPATTNAVEADLEQQATNTTNIAAIATNTTSPPPVEKAKKKGNKGKMVAYLGMFLATAICLGLFLAHDISQYVGAKAVKVIYNDEGEGVKNPEYEQAEQTWANGRYLEAIQQMRDYLKKNPREQYVALRIAEIYEKDLNNPIAAALEYEEVLKYKLPDERWGWAAVHLANIYSGKLNREADAIALLRRIDSNYPNTAAAKKARERLGKVDPAPVAEAPAAPSAPASNLPKGFRPKK